VTCFCPLHHDRAPIPAQEAGSTTDACTVLPVDGKPHQTKPNQTKPNGYHPSPACEEEQLRYARPPSEPQRASCCAFPEIRCVLCLFFFIFHFVMFFNTTCSLSTGLVCLRGRIRAARHKSGGDSGPLQTMHDRLSFAPDGSASNSLNTTQKNEKGDLRINPVPVPGLAVEVPCISVTSST
jgi:hypothetical protein